jgi:hypothetical protein
MSDSRLRINCFFYVFPVFFLGIIFYGISVKFIHPVEYANRDFFSFWLAGYVTKLGQNPYSTEIWVRGHDLFGASWIPNLTFIYPLPLSLIFVPFALLSLYQAYVVWGIFTQFMIVISVFLLLRLSPKIQIKHFIFLVLVGIILSRQAITTLVIGQISGFLLVVITCVLYCWQRGKWRLGTAILPILALKPNLGIPIISLLLIYLIRKKEYPSLIFGGISSFVLLLLGFVQNPRWMLDFWNVGINFLSSNFGFSPTIWGISSFLCHFDLNCTIVYGSFICVLIFGAYGYLIMRKTQVLSPMIVIGFSTTIMLLITPYTWTYDQLLLLIPILSLAFSLSDDGVKFVPISMILLAMGIFAMILVWVTAITQLEIWNAALPLSVLGFSFWYVFSLS